MKTNRATKAIDKVSASVAAALTRHGEIVVEHAKATDARLSAMEARIAELERQVAERKS